MPRVKLRATRRARDNSSDNSSSSSTTADARPADSVLADIASTLRLMFGGKSGRAPKLEVMRARSFAVNRCRGGGDGGLGSGFSASFVSLGAVVSPARDSPVSSVDAIRISPRNDPFSFGPPPARFSSAGEGEEAAKRLAAAATAESTAAADASIRAFTGDSRQCSSIPGGSGSSPRSRGSGRKTPLPGRARTGSPGAPVDVVARGGGGGGWRPNLSPGKDRGTCPEVSRSIAADTT